ncbi:peptide chain release factor 2 [Streptomyces thermovulgaris]|uniref:peptide chain release factor 2 n=1 Tax=Streptomyces thermovulgaris TaxID=1934 RepID=UPI003CCB8840
MPGARRRVGARAPLSRSRLEHAVSEPESTPRSGPDTPEPGPGAGTRDTGTATETGGRDDTAAAAEHGADPAAGPEAEAAPDAEAGADPADGTGAAGLSEAEAELAAVKKALDEMEVRTLLSGEYDAREALVNIRAEAGGVDAADFAERLQRMYLRWAERHGYKTEVYETSYAEEAGIKSTTFVVQAPYAYGTLSVEQGTHRLVRISPFDNQGRRQTSFAGVEVLPVVEQSDHVEIDESDLRIDVYRSSGPGGQGVNTTDSAVRITHIPTGIVVSCQNERSQIQNKATAMNVLQAKLLELRRQEEQAKMDALKGDGGNSWGNQMRSYVLHPYQMVKDLRTEYEVGNPEAVFNGEIDGFLEAGIRWRKQQEQQKKQQEQQKQ